MSALSMDDIPLKKWRWLAPIPACCVLQCLFGLLYASGVFIARLDIPMYTISIGVAGFFIAVGMTGFGIIMNKLSSPHHYRRAPFYIAMIGSIGLTSQCFMPYALQQKNTTLLFLCAILLGIANGCLYVSSLDVLQAWVPESPGLITGAGMLFASAGSLGGTYVFNMLSNSYGGPLPAMSLVGACSGLLAMCASALVRRPPKNWRPEEDMLPLLKQEARSDMESQTIDPSLTMRDILSEPSFYALMLAFAATVGPGFGFVLGFQAMCADLFLVDLNRANSLFLWVSVVGVLGRVIAGVAVHWLQKKSLEPDGLGGAKKANHMLLLTQAAAFLSIPYCIQTQNVILFTVAASVVYISFGGGSVVTACLVRGIFTPNNSSMAFSLVASSIGVGDIFFSWVIARCAQNAQGVFGSSNQPFHQNSYNLFWCCGILWSVIGLIATVMISRSKKLPAEEVSIPLAHALRSG